MGTRWLMPALCAACVLVSSACGDSTSSSDGDNPPPGDVLVRNDFYQPATLEVTTGTTVTWAWNSGGVEHTVTFDDGPDSGRKSSGTFTRTFTAAGPYPYHCLVHGTSMSGTITVTEAAGGAGGDGGTPPAGGGGSGGGGSGGGYPGY